MPGEAPFVSVVIATHRRPGPLAACLTSLVTLDYPRDRFEVIVVDDGGDMPPDSMAPFRGRLDVTLIGQARTGPAGARNTGARRAKGDLIAFTDDDCLADPRWVRALAARLDGSGNAIGGRTLNALPHNVYSTASQILIDYLYAYYNPAPEDAVFFASNNLAIPRREFLAIGGFDESFGRPAGEDREFCDRWRGLGHGMIYAADALVHHGHVLTLRRFWRQHFNYGCGAVHFHRARARRSGERLRLEPVSFYLNLLRYPFSRAPEGRGLQLAALLVVSQAANAAGFVRERARASAPRRAVLR